MLRTRFASVVAVTAVLFSGVGVAQAAPTAARIDVVPGAESLRPSSFVALKGAMYFGGSNAAGGLALYRSDGTQAGTQAIVALAPAPPFRGLEPRVVGATTFGGALYFATIADDGASGAGQLWRSDGTAAGTTKVTAIPASLVYEFITVGGRMVLTQGTSGPGRLLASDGTAAGTVPLANSEYTLVTQLGSSVYFQSTATGRPIKRTDGVSIFDAYPGGYPTGNGLFGACGTSLVLASGTTMSISDGVGAPVKVFDAYPGDRIHCLGSRVLFFPSNAGYRPWMTDGTLAGTAPLLSFPSTALSRLAIPVGPATSPKLAFDFTDEMGARGLWVTSGSAATTKLLKAALGTPVSIGTVAGQTFFVNSPAAELYSTDGVTVNGPISTGTAGSPLGESALLGGKIFSTAPNTAAEGVELWVLDTGLVPDPPPGLDGGTLAVGTDAGVRDAAGDAVVTPTPEDAAAGSVPSTGDAGCGCAQASTDASSGAGIWALVGLTAAALRARRRRSRDSA